MELIRAVTLTWLFSGLPGGAANARGAPALGCPPCVWVWLPVRDVGLRLDVNDPRVVAPKSVGMLVAEATMIGVLDGRGGLGGGLGVVYRQGRLSADRRACRRRVTAHDALAAHLDAELRLDPDDLATLGGGGLRLRRRSRSERCYP